MNGGAMLGTDDMALPLEAAESLLLACRTVAARHPEGEGVGADGYDLLTIQLAMQSVIGSAMAAQLGHAPTMGAKAIVGHDRFEALWLGVGSGLGHALSNCGNAASMSTASDSMLSGLAQAVMGRVNAGTGPKG